MDLTPIQTSWANFTPSVGQKNALQVILDDAFQLIKTGKKTKQPWWQIKAAVEARGFEFTD